MATKQKDTAVKTDAAPGLNLSAMLATNAGAATAGDIKEGIAANTDTKKPPETEVAAASNGPTGGGTDVLDPSHPDYKAPGIIDEPANDHAGWPRETVPAAPAGAVSSGQPAWSTAETFDDQPMTPFEVVKRKVLPDADDGRAFMSLDDGDEILSVSFVNGELFVNVLSYLPENPNGNSRIINVVASGVKRYLHPGRYIGSVTVPHNGLVLCVFEEMYSDEPVATTDDIDFSGLAGSEPLCQVDTVAATVVHSE